MNLYKISHIFGCEGDYEIGPQTRWQPYDLQLKQRPVKRLKGTKNHVFISSYFNENEENDYLPEMLFWPDGFFALEELLLSGGNQAECGLIDDQIAMFRVNPVAPVCAEAYPTYAQIAEALPTDLHYFIKYPQTDFRLVTETYVQRVNELGLKGMRFVLRWDGKRSYPILPGEKKLSAKK